MFNSPPRTSFFSFGKLIGGISKTLNVANQVIPLYIEAKPMIQNARNAFSSIKEFSNVTTAKIVENRDKNIKPIKEKLDIIKNNSTINNEQNKKGPTFFL